MGNKKPLRAAEKGSIGAGSLRVTRKGVAAAAEIQGSPSVEALEVDYLRAEYRESDFLIIADQFDFSGAPSIRVEAHCSAEVFDQFWGSLQQVKFRESFSEWREKSRHPAPAQAAVDRPPINLVKRRFQIARLAHVGGDAELVLFSFPLYVFIDKKAALEVEGQAIELPLHGVARFTFNANLMAPFLESCAAVAAARATS